MLLANAEYIDYEDIANQTPGIEDEREALALMSSYGGGPQMMN